MYYYYVFYFIVNFVKIAIKDIVLKLKFYTNFLNINTLKMRDVLPNRKV